MNALTKTTRRHPSKSALVATALIAAAGLASPALAGGHGEAKAGSKTTSKSTNRTDGNQTTVWSDGTREIRVERKGDAVLICCDGHEIGSFSCAEGHDEHFKVHDSAAKVKAVRDGHQLTVFDENGEELCSVNLDGDEFHNLNWSQFDGQKPGFALMAGQAAPGAPHAPRVMIGVTMDSVSDDDAPEGLDAGKVTRIMTVMKGLPASEAGVEDGDIIIAFNGEDDASPDVIREVLRGKEPGDEVRVRVYRDGKKKDLVLKLRAYDHEKLGMFRQGSPAPGQFFQWNEGAQAELQAKLADLSEKLEKLGAEMGSAVSDQVREKIGREMGRLGAEMGRIGAEMGRMQAEQALRHGFAADPDRVQIRRRGPGEPPEAIIVRPEGAPRTGPMRERSRADAQRLESIEERLERLEKLLERLAEQQEKSNRDR